LSFPKDVLIFDIETRTPTGKPNPDVDIFRFFGANSYKHGKYYFYNEHEKENILQLLSEHPIIIGFNSKEYDMPIMQRDGIWREYKSHIDLRETIKKRQILLDCKQEAKSLKNMAIFFGLDVSKGDLDYSLLNKDRLTREELLEIEKYTIKDIEVTKGVYEHLFNFFLPFKGYMNDYDQEKLKWISASPGAYAYKVICHQTGIPEEYSEDTERKKFEGGFVSAPFVDYAKDDIYCLDFNSLYPHCFIQANLYSHSCMCCDRNEKWAGNELYPVNGRYCTKKRGLIENFLIRLYNERLEYKKTKDRREFVNKIILNTMYGISGSPIFKNVYNYNTASDCTLMARNSTKYARKVFQEAGYQVLYSDTDSVFLKDVFKDKKRLLDVKNKIIKHIKENLPFPIDTFSMGIDAEIKHIWFFKKDGEYLKKHYVYVENNGRVTVKGLPMIKGDGSGIGLLIFNKYMKKHVEHGKLKFSLREIQKWLALELKNNMEIVSRVFNVHDPNTYKNTSQLQYQIAKKYGAGRHRIIVNKKFGVGKSKRYCTIQEFEQLDLKIRDLDLGKFWSEMEYFISEFSNFKNRAKLIETASKHKTLDPW